MATKKDIKPYIGPYRFPKSPSPIYIHKYIKDHIGFANNGSKMTDGQLASYYRTFKDRVTAANKAYYKKLYSSSMTGLNAESKALLKEVFETDDALTEFDRYLQQQIQSNINIKAAEQIHALSVAVAGEKIGEDLLNANKYIEAYNKLLTALAKAVNLIKSEEGKNLAVRLLKERTDAGSGATLADLGGNLLRALNEFAARNEGSTFQEQQIRHVISNIEPLAKGLITTNKGETLTGSGAQQLITNLFATGFYEAIVGISDNIALSASDNELLKPILTGSTSVGLAKTDVTGTMITIDETNQRYGKADRRDNITIKYNIDKNSSKSAKILIDVGLSDKLYRSMDFYPGHNSKKFTDINSGSGGNIADTLLSIDNSDKFLYLSYNTIAGGRARPAALEALQDLMLRRSLTRLFASRGGSADFTQFILVNGRVFSIWELIQKVENTDFLGKSFSQSKDSNQLLKLSLGGDSTKGKESGRLGMIAAKRRGEEVVERSLAVQYAAAKGAITAHLNLKTLLGLI